jgi:5-(carboxyamino)imidazole ribonucleotide synthase
VNVGILGGGQLGRMLALAGYPLGMRFRFLEPSPNPPVAGLGEIVAGSYDDVQAARRFAAGLDVVTYEFENVPVATAEALAGEVEVYPPTAALEMAQDRLVEKRGFRDLDIPTAAFRAVDSEADLTAALGDLGLPAVLKTRRFGYDGKGQFVLRDEADQEAAWSALGGRPLLLEAWVPFRRELAILGVRCGSGEARFYPLAETHHGQGILERAFAPALDVEASVQRQAESYAGRVMERLGYVGVLAVELFDTVQGLMANEMAPRVHNSGHWTQDGAPHCQFENHMRAVCGLPLGSTTVTEHAAMVNLLGEVPPVAEILALPGTHLHLYGKSPRPGRKLGHVNVGGEDPAAVRRTVERITALLHA